MEGYYTGRVSSIDYSRGFVRVAYPSENNNVSDWLPLLASEYNPPAVGDLVAVILDKNQNGVCLGKIFSYSQPPKNSNAQYEKDMDDIKITKANGVFRIDFGDAHITYMNGTITVSADKIILNGYTPPKG